MGSSQVEAEQINGGVQERMVSSEEQHGVPGSSGPEQVHKIAAAELRELSQPRRHLLPTAGAAERTSAICNGIDGRQLLLSERTNQGVYRSLRRK